MFSVEISEESVVKLQDEAASRELPQVHPALGQSDSPNLPENSVDMAFMHDVYHHLAKPREMLTHREASHRRMIAPETVEVGATVSK